MWLWILVFQLLGKECYDIDIALDSMLGSEFVDKIQDYLLSIGEKAQGVAVIPRYIFCFSFLVLYFEPVFVFVLVLHFFFNASHQFFFFLVKCYYRVNLSHFFGKVILR